MANYVANYVSNYVYESYVQRETKKAESPKKPESIEKLIAFKNKFLNWIDN